MIRHKPIPARWEPYPQIARVERQDSTTGEWQTIIERLRCRVWPVSRDLSDLGWGIVVTGTHRMVCDWDDIVDDDNELLLRPGDRVVLDPSAWGGVGPVQVYHVRSVTNPAQLDYQARVVLEEVAAHEAVS